MASFESQNLIYRDINANDISEEMVADLNNQNYLQYSNNRFKHHTVASQNQYLESFYNSPNEYVGGFLKDSKMLAVTLTFFINEHHFTADIGILVRPGFSDKKIGLEAYDAGVRYLFEVRKIRKVTGETLKSNLKMCKIFQRLGFKLEGVREKQEIVGKQQVDQLLYGKFND